MFLYDHCLTPRINKSCYFLHTIRIAYFLKTFKENKFNQF